MVAPVELVAPPLLLLLSEDGDEMAAANGLDENNEESWNGEKLDRLIRAERGDEGLTGPAAALMLFVEAAGAISLSELM